MSSSATTTTTLETLSNELQIIILKHVSLYDLYHVFFSLNERYKHLVKHVTPLTISRKCLIYDIAVFGILISYYWVWNDTFVYFMMPQLRQRQPDRLQWLFLTPDEFHRQIEQLDSRVVNIISKYKVQSNAPSFLVDPRNYYFCSLSDDLPRLEQWIEENYPEQYEVIKVRGPRHHLPKRMDHHDGKYPEIKQALADVQRLERLKRENLIYEYTQQIWNELKVLENMNLLDIVVEE